MDEIDNIIIQNLLQIGCEIDENTTLASLDPATIVKCVSRCLRSIDPSLQLPESMPTGMAQKYGVTLALAEKCTEIGFRGDIGYQTFLYSNNVQELRRVLMFLIDRLPKDDTDSGQSMKELSEKEQLDLEMKRKLAISLKGSWRFNPMAVDRVGLSYDNTPDDYDIRRSIFLQTKPGNLWSTILSHNDGSSLGMSRESFPISRSVQGLNKRSSTSATSIQGGESPDDQTLDTEQDTIPEQIEDPLAEKRECIATLREQIAMKQEERVDISRKIEKLKKKSQTATEKLEELKTQKKIKERTLLVLENPQENIQKLQKMIENSGEKMKRLQEQWVEVKTPLQTQLEELNERKSERASKTKVIEDQIQEVRQKQNVIRSETNSKAQQYAHYMEELGKVNQKIDRSAYTSRILEIIGNIRKQKMDIDKILRDTREVQKDINTVTGKLERQFTVTDDLLFAHAKRDEQTKRIYKLFLKVHADCGELAKSIQDTGKISREIRDLEDQIENSKARNTSANLQQVSMDLQEMQAENDKLFQEIQRIRHCGLPRE